MPIRCKLRIQRPRLIEKRDTEKRERGKRLEGRGRGNTNDACRSGKLALHVGATRGRARGLHRRTKSRQRHGKIEVIRALHAPVELIRTLRRRSKRRQRQDWMNQGISQTAWNETRKPSSNNAGLMNGPLNQHFARVKQAYLEMAPRTGPFCNQ